MWKPVPVSFHSSITTRFYTSFSWRNTFSLSWGEDIHVTLSWPGGQSKGSTTCFSLWPNWFRLCQNSILKSLVSCKWLRELVSVSKFHTFHVNKCKSLRKDIKRYLHHYCNHKKLGFDTVSFKVAEHSFSARFCWCQLARAQGFQKTNMPSTERSFYLFNTRTICVIFSVIACSVLMALVFYYNDMLQKVTMQRTQHF